MSWIGQVGHVVAKDVRHLAWLVAISVLVTVGATLTATDVVASPFDETTRITWLLILRGLSAMPAVALVGVVLVILILQSDSSARSDAFWVTRPLAPSAVLGAKLAVVVALLLVLPLGGQLAALLVRGVPAGRLLPLLAESAASMAGVLGVAAVFAALTPDLRTLLTAFLVTFTGWMLAVRLVSVPLTRRSLVWTSDLALYVPGTLLALTGLAVAAYQYRTRDVRRTLRLFGLPGLLVALLLAVPRGYFGSGDAMGDAPVELRAAALTARMRDLQIGTGRGEGAWEAVLELRLPDADLHYQYVLSGGSVTFRLQDGTTVVRSFRGYAQREVTLGQAQLDAPGYAWIGPRASSAHNAQGVVWVPVTDRLATALREGSVSARVEGRVVVREPREVARIPLRAGAAYARDGTTYRIDRLEEGLTGPIVSTSVELVASGSDLWQSSPTERSDVVALNPVRREAVHLAAKSGGGGTGHDLVLPGPSAREYRATLAARLQPVPAEKHVPGLAWMRDAEMAIVEWIPIGAYALDAQVGTVTLER